jgi:hypothetical protein
MIRPAVGDHGQKTNQPDSTLENDSDWIKIQDYVAKLNPKILDEAQSVSLMSEFCVDEQSLYVVKGNCFPQQTKSIFRM